LFRLKKFDFLLLRNFIGPFLLVFLVVMFTMIMQFLWKYVDDLVGKGLSWMVIVQLLFYMSATLVPMAIPIAILLASIMTLGSLGEYYELTAMKSSGTGLPRILYSLLLFATFMMVLSFLFSNYVFPVANLKGYSLLFDVREQKPALNIKEGMFYNGIQGYSIRVGKKDNDGQTIHQVYVYDNTSGRGDDNVLYADRGTMRMSDDKQYLQVELFDGRQYQEMAPTADKSKGFEQTRLRFKQWKKTFDLSDLKFSRTKEDLFRENFQMKNIAQLKASIDTFHQELKRDEKDLFRNLRPTYCFTRIHLDSLFEKRRLQPLSFESDQGPADRFAIYDKALMQARNAKQFVGFDVQNYAIRQDNIVKHEIEIQRKYAYAFACIMLLLIGAPLGAIIRKGGIGWPIVVAIFFFALYYILTIIGEKLAAKQILSPLAGMWFSTLILMPFGLFLLYKSSRDQLVFNTDRIYSLVLRIARRFRSRKPAPPVI